MESQSTEQIFSNQLLNIPERKRLLKTSSLKLIKISLISFLAFFVLPISALAQNISWTGDGDGTSWGQASNWSENRVPGPEDDVAVMLNGTYTISQSGNIHINSLVFGADDGTQTLIKTTGNLQLNTQSTIGSNAVLEISAGYIIGDGSLINNGIIRSNAASGTGINNFTLVNNGQIEHINGIFYLVSNATLENNGLYDTQGDVSIIQSGAASTFINSGRFLKSDTDEGLTNINVGIDSRPGSIIESAAGELRLQGASLYHDMSFVADDDNSIIRILTTTHTFRGSITGSPTGLVILNTNAEAHEEGASFDFGGNGLTWSSGYIIGGGTFTNEGLIKLDAPSWTGVNGSTLINNGTIEQLAGIFYLTSGAVLENNSLYDIQNDINIVQSGAASLIINTGRIVKTVTGDGFSAINVSINSRPESIIESAAGELRLQGASQYHDMSFVADENSSIIRLLSTPQTFRGSITGSPTGLVILNTNAEAHAEGASFDFGGTGLTWSSGYMIGGGTFTNEGLIRLDAPSWTGVNGSSLINNGAIEQLAGIFYLASGAILENNSLYDIQNDINITQSGAASLIINTGRIVKTVTDDGLSAINVSIDSRPESIIESAAGELRLQGASQYHDMSFVADENSSIIRLLSTPQTFRGSITGSPTGLVILNTNAEAHEEGTLFDFGGTGLTWSSGYMVGGGTFTNEGLIKLDAPSWTGVNGSILINNGTIEQLAGIFYLTSGAVLENNEIFRANGGSGIIQSGALSTLTNNDRLLLNSSNSTFTISVRIVNNTSSTLDVQQGDVRLTNTGEHNAPNFAVSEDASLSFYSGTHVFNGPITTQPAGDFIIRTNFSTETGSTQFNITGTGLLWENGALTSGTITNTGSITMPGGGFTGLNGGTIINTGEMTLLGSSFRIMHPGELQNESIFTAADNFNIISGSPEQGLFINSGLFNKTGGDGTSTIRSEMINESTGEIRLFDGTLQFLSDLTHNDGALISGTGNIDIARATVSLNGIITPGLPVGTLSYTGDFEPNDTTSVLNVYLYLSEGDTPEPSSTLLSVMESDYSVNFNRVGGAATLAGDLNLSIDSNYIPDAGTEFEILRTEKGISGGFSSYKGLVDIANQRAYYPQIRDTSLILITTNEIPALTGTIAAEPAEIQAGEEQMIMFTGAGFPPDLSVQLTCLECNEPDLFSTITGRVGSISPDTARVWFDVSDPMISGTYQAVLTDPRGGTESTDISINQAPLELSVDILKQSTEGADNTGLFVIRSNRRSLETINVPFSLFGSAQQYVHYTTDLLGDSFPFPAGSDSVVVSIVPLQTETPQMLTVGLQIEQVNQGPDVAFRTLSTFASMDIRTGSENNNELRVLNYTPDRGGNVGFVTLTMSGLGFTESTSIRLSDGLNAQNIEVNETGTKMTGSLNLIGQPTGLKDIIVSNGSTEVVLPSAFRVETGIYPEIFVQVFAPVRVPRIRNRTYTIILENQGNVDVRGYAAIGGLPADADWSIDDSEFGINANAGFEWKDVAPVTQKGETIQVSFPYMNLAAGETRKINLTTSVPTPQVMQLVAAWFYN
jgi:hypothetical protein